MMDKPASISRWLIFGLATIVVLTFARLCTSEFLYWDDISNISDNPWMKRPWLEIVGHYFRHGESGLYIPVTYSLWGALAWLGMTTVPNAQGDLFNPWIFHGFNVVLHVIITLLVFRMLYKISDKPAAAALAAAFFALHPVQVETVGWVSGSKDLLCWFFVAVGLNLYLDLIARSGNQSVLHFCTRWRFWIVFALMIVAFLSKPTAMVMSALLIVIDHFLNRTRLRIAVMRALPFFLITVVGVLITRRVQVAVGVYEPNVLGKLLVAGDALAHYAVKIVWPFDLTFDYGRRPDWVLFESKTVRFIWLIPTVIGFIALAFWKRQPALTGAALIFLICVSPMLGFVPFMFQAYSTVSDHYMYFAMFGAAVGVAVGLAKFSVSYQWIFLPVVLALAVLSFRQCAVWRDTTTLMTAGIEKNPRSFASYNNLGLDQTNRMEIGQAIESFTRAVELNPKLLIGFRNRARVRQQYLGDYASAEKDLQQVLDLVRASDPPAASLDTADALLELATTRIRMGKLESASELIDEAESIQPDHGQLHAVKLELTQAIRQSLVPSD